jgi:hypothetical protein
MRACYVKVCALLEELPRTGLIQDRAIRSDWRTPLAGTRLRPAKGQARLCPPELPER